MTAPRRPDAPTGPRPGDHVRWAFADVTALAHHAGGVRRQLHVYEHLADVMTGTRSP